MKGGNLHRSKGKHFVVTLLAVICMTILLLYYERKPLVTTLLTPQDQFDLPTSDVLQVASHVSEDLVKSKDHSIPEPLVVRDEIDDKTKPQLVNVENTEPVAEKSSITKEDEQSSPVHEETGNKTKPHYNIENTESVSFKSSASEEDERSSKVHKERKDKTKPQNNFENAELVSFKSSASQEDERSSQVHEEKEDKTKPQNNFENAELVSFKSSASQEDEWSSQVHEEREDKTKPRIANARNTEPMAEQSSVSGKDERDAASSTEKKRSY